MLKTRNNVADSFDFSTVIVIAHKLQSIRNADCIFVIAGGKLVEEGTHNNLVEKRGQYHELVKSQL
jgi:ABC-type multidrug transport system fused ATPase/permease subunit